MSTPHVTQPTSKGSPARSIRNSRVRATPNTSARRLMTAEASAAVAGAIAGGATEVVVNDSHGDCRNVLADALDARARLVEGKPRELGMMAGVEGCNGVFLVGWHAKAQVAGVLSHTIDSFAFARGQVNGSEIGEAGLYGAAAAEFGVPVALMSGDDAFIAETSPLFPGAVGVIVKRAHGHRCATSLSPANACAAIVRGARDALACVPTLRLKPVASPLAIPVQAAGPALGDLFVWLPLLRRVDAVTLDFQAPTMRHAVRVLSSISAMSALLR